MQISGEWFVLASEGIREVDCGVFGQDKVKVQVSLWCGVAGVAEFGGAQLCGREFGVGVAVCGDALGWCLKKEVLCSFGDHTHALLPAIDGCDVSTHGACLRADDGQKDGSETKGKEAQRHEVE